MSKKIFFILVISLILILLPFISAQEKNSPDVGAMASVAKLFLLFLVIIIIFFALNSANFPENIFIKVLLSLVIGFFGTVLITNNEIITILQSYFGGIKDFFKIFGSINFEGIIDFFKNTKAYLADTGLKTIFGFEMKPYLIGSFLIGFFTGFMIWLVYFLIRLYHLFSDKLVIDKDEEFLTQEGGIRWLNLVAGRIWKVPLIAIVYMVLLQIPILNRFIQLITLQFLFIHWFWTSLVIAIEIGFLPFLIEETKKVMYETKLREKLLQHMSTRYN